MRFWLVLASLLVAATAEEKPEKKRFGRCDISSSSGETGCHNIPEIMELQTTECQPYHIILTRGTDEKAPGRQGNLSRLICDKFGGKEYCGWENVDYPAKSRIVSDTSWCESADIGAKNGQKQIQEYVQKCPDTKLILLGLSQGASIMQDVLGGGGGPVFKCTQQTNPPLDRTTSPGKNIAAAVSFGAVRRVSSASYSVKSGKDFKSVSERSDQQREALEKWADVLRDYCHDGDYMCAESSSQRDMEKHLSYMSIYTEEIVDWVVRKVNRETHKHSKLLLHQLSDNRHWLLGGLMFSLALMCTALYFLTWFRRYCLTCLRRRLIRGF